MNEADLPWPPGTWVRVITDPGRQGAITGKTKRRGDQLYLQVRFPDRPAYQPADVLEPVDDDQDAHPIDDAIKGIFGRPADLRRSLTHIRLNGRLADVIYSMETTNTEFYAYQFKPVLKFLDSPASGILIADEVGLGKTIEAGLIWTELRARYDAKALAVLCPAVLRQKWKAELATRFGIDARIVDPREFEALVGDFRSGARKDLALICSMQGFRPPRGWDDDSSSRPAAKVARLLRDIQFETPLFDLVIVDEAHYLRNEETQTHRFARALRDVSNQVAFLSATPVHLRSKDLFNLVRLLDESTFSDMRAFDSILEANEPIVAVRDAILGGSITPPDAVAALETGTKHPLLSGNRQIVGLIDEIRSCNDFDRVETRIEYAHRLDRANLLTNVVSRTRKRDVHEFRVMRMPIPEAVSLAPVERQFYDLVTETVRKYAARREAHESFLLVTPQRQMSSCMPAALMRWKRKASAAEEDLIFEDMGVMVENSKAPIGPLTLELADGAQEFTDVDELIKMDSKYARLKSMFEKYLEDDSKAKIILFSFFIDTLSYLARRLTEDGFSHVVLTGAQKDKNEIIEEFREGSANILLASEVASEGVDLQFSRLLVNYDLPWNPMRVEQRIGRIDRIGQQADSITIWNLFYNDTIDARIYERLYDRLDLFRKCLGELEGVLGDEMQTLTVELMRGKLSSEQEQERIDQTTVALQNRQKEEERLESEAGKLIAHGDYILNEVTAARELGRWISAGDLLTYIRDHLERNYPGCELRQISDERPEFEMSLSSAARLDFAEFLRKSKVTHPTSLISSSAPYVKVLFQNRVGIDAENNKKGLEIISQFHPLVRFVASERSESQEGFQRSLAGKVAQSSVPEVALGDFAFAVHRWSVSGMRDIERIAMDVRPLTNPEASLSNDVAEALILKMAVDGTDWPGVANEVDRENAGDTMWECHDALEDRYRSYINELSDENQDRADIQERSVRSHWEIQKTRLEGTKQKHLEFGRQALVKATQGQIDALGRRMEIKLAEIERRREVQYHSEQIAVGVVRVI